MNTFYAEGMMESATIMRGMRGNMDETSQTKNISITVRVPEETFVLLSQINKADRRSGVSEVTRLLLMRGVDLYRKDGKLFEQETKPVTAGKKREAL